MEPSRTAVTRLLHEWSGGRREALDELFPLVYEELRRLAAFHLRGEHGPPSLQATELVDEIYLRLVHQAGIHADTRAQFFGLAARTMRALLVDLARARHAAKREGSHRGIVPAAAGLSLSPPSIDVLALHEALTRLAANDPRQERIVELRFFAGLTIDEVARVLNVSPATVSREWMQAKAWLHAELNGAISWPPQRRADARLGSPRAATGRAHPGHEGVGPRFSHVHSRGRSSAPTLGP